MATHCASPPLPAWPHLLLEVRHDACLLAGAGVLKGLLQVAALEDLWGAGGREAGGGGSGGEEGRVRGMGRVGAWGSGGVEAAGSTRALPRPRWRSGGQERAAPCGTPPAAPPHAPLARLDGGEAGDGKLALHLLVLLGGGINLWRGGKGERRGGGGDQRGSPARNQGTHTRRATHVHTNFGWLCVDTALSWEGRPQACIPSSIRSPQPAAHITQNLKRRAFPVPWPVDHVGGPRRAPTLASTISGSKPLRPVAALAHSGSSFLQWPHQGA